jgi:hypothetical protein
MFSYELPSAKTEAHVRSDMDRLYATALNCSAFSSQSSTLTVLKGIEMAEHVFTHECLSWRDNAHGTSIRMSPADYTIMCFKSRPVIV